MQIRGATSFRGSTEPLIVVDGMPMRRGAGALAFVAPADVSRIEVLRRPEELAPYGMQGANGVVLITTRRR